MNKTYILTPIAMGIGALLWISASGGVAKIQQKDRTGSPVSDPTCNMCHASGISFSTVPTIIISDSSGAVTSYEPLKKYTVTVDIQSTGNVGHGFQMTGLLADNTTAGLVESVNGNTQKTVLNDRWYFEHKQPLTGGSYSMVWIAPAAGKGDVTFYGSALSTNGSNSTTGDEFQSIPEVVLTESVVNSVVEVNQDILKLYPNPAVNELTLNLGTEIISAIEVYSITGTRVLNTNVNSTSFVLDISSLNKGSYFVKVTGVTGQYTSRFIKR